MRQFPVPTRFAIDVATVAPRGVHTVVADVFLPARERMRADGQVLCCLPGGGTSRRYFDLEVDPALGNYSMARHLAQQGFVVVTLDHPGFGDPLPMQRRGSSDFLVGAPMPEPVHEALLACRSPLLALVGLSSMIPGASAPVLAQIDVPVFVAHGSRDIAGSLHAVPAIFPA